METTVRLLEGVKFEAVSRGHSVICDQPQNNGGTDAGMSPPEFLLVSLSTCAMFYAVEYLRTRSLPLEGVTVRVAAEKAQAPARLGTFRIEVNVPGIEDERHKEGVARAVKSCLVHNTLLHTPEVETVVNTITAVHA